LADEPFDPRRYLQFAEHLAAAASDETSLRVAVGRAYYAVFLEVRAFTGTAGRHGIHGQIANALNHLGLSNVASQVGTMRHFREVADYEELPRIVSDRNWQRNWEQTRSNAHRIFARLDAFRAETDVNDE
jgi:hypothetical protein